MFNEGEFVRKSRAQNSEPNKGVRLRDIISVINTIRGE